MIYRIPEKEVEFDTFDMVFGGTLNRQNRWVVLAGLISWDEVEEKYSKPLCSEKWSAGLPVRVALIIKRKAEAFFVSIFYTILEMARQAFVAQVWQPRITEREKTGFLRNS
jgi:hypothetical protein